MWQYSTTAKELQSMDYSQVIISTVHIRKSIPINTVEQCEGRNTCGGRRQLQLTVVLGQQAMQKHALGMCGGCYCVHGWEGLKEFFGLIQKVSTSKSYSRQHTGQVKLHACVVIKICGER